MPNKNIIRGLALVLLLGAVLLYANLRKFPDIHSQVGAASPAIQVNVEQSNLDSIKTDSMDVVLQKIQAMTQAGDAFDRVQFSALMARLVQGDPTAAAHFVETLNAGEMRNEALRRTAQMWAAQDSISAEKWGSLRTDPSERQLALSCVCYQVAQSDAHSALEMAQRDGLNSQPIMVDLACQWAQHDFAAAKSWVEMRPVSEQRDRMFSGLAVIQAAADPEGAADMVQKQIAPGPVQADAVMAVLDGWAKRDMDGASAWIELFPSSTVRVRAEKELARIAAFPNPNIPRK